jgi:soluble lytic murein transglycosylase-like protein
VTTPSARFRFAAFAVILAVTKVIVGPAQAETGASIPSETAGVNDLRREAYRAIARRHAEAMGLPFAMVDAVMQVESGYRADARGGAGEIGLMQVMPPTARLLGFTGTLEALAEPEHNIRLGVTYLAEAWRLAKGDICTAAMKYRAGHRETRFSVLSVRYCVNVRRHLAAHGYPVTGSVPEPTFGFGRDRTRMGVAIGSVAAARRLFAGRKLKSRVGWAAYEARMKQLDAKARRIGL